MSYTGPVIVARARWCCIAYMLNSWLLGWPVVLDTKEENKSGELNCPKMFIAFDHLLQGVCVQSVDHFMWIWRLRDYNDTDQWISYTRKKLASLCLSHLTGVMQAIYPRSRPPIQDSRTAYPTMLTMRLVPKFSGSVYKITKRGAGIPKRLRCFLLSILRLSFCTTSIMSQATVADASGMFSAKRVYTFQKDVACQSQKHSMWWKTTYHDLQT